MAKAILYWLTTGLVALSYLGGGYYDIAQPAEAMEAATRLKYPNYFFTILGVWKIGAFLVLLAPKLPRLKEWTYAGIFFNLTGAAASHAFVKDPLGDIAVPLIILTMAMISWWLRPASRRLNGPVL